MRKTLASLAALLLVLACSKKQAELTTTQWKQETLKGKVKTISTYAYNTEGEKETTYLMQYDEKNQLLEELTYIGDTLASRKIIHRDDESGNPLMVKEIIYYNTKEKDSTTFVYTYNDKGLNTRIESDSHNATINEYNEQGLLVHSFSNEDESDGDYYTYDDNNRMTKKQRLSNYTVYEYDDAGKPVSQKVYESGSDVLLLTVKFSYDDKGRREREIYRDVETPSALTYDLVMRYDDENRLIEQKVIDEDGRPEIQVIHTYDEKGNMVEEKKVRDRSEFAEISTYTYDEQGNWIEMRYSVNDVTYRIVREIEYHDS